MRDKDSHKKQRLKKIKKIVTKILISGGVVIIAVASLFAVGTIANKFKKTIVAESSNIDREIFKNSKSYVEGKINDLAKYKREYDKANIDEKIGIKNFIIEDFANFDEKLIESEYLADFLKEIRG